MNNDNIISLKNLQRLEINKKHIPYLLNIYEEKGKTFYYNNLFNKSTVVLMKNNSDENIYYFLKYLDLNWTEAKIKLWSRKTLKPKNKEETFVHNFKKAVRKIDFAVKDIELYVSEINDLISILSHDLEKITFANKSDYIFDQTSISAKQMLNEIINLYRRYDEKNEVEKVMLIINFYIDLYNLKLFTKHNELISIILLYFLIKSKFSCFNFVPFFKYIYEYKDELKQAALESSYKWEAGFAKIDLYYDILLKIVKKGYIDLKNKGHKFSFDEKTNKTDNIEGSILNGPDVFSKEDVRLRHPNSSDSTISRTLKRLNMEGKIRLIGIGRNAKWHLVEKNTVTQLSLFSNGEFEK